MRTHLAILSVLASAGLVAGAWWWRGDPSGRVPPTPAKTGTVQGAFIRPRTRPQGSASTNQIPTLPPAGAGQASVVPPLPLAATPAGDGTLEVTFDKLASFEYLMAAEPLTNSPALIPGGSELIPAEIRAFDQKRVGLKGFMLPLKVQNGLVTELLLMRDQSMCCYAVTPKITEWVNVKMTGKGVKPLMDQPVTLFGQFHVGEMRESGYLVGLYRMDADRMATPLDL